LHPSFHHPDTHPEVAFGSNYERLRLVKKQFSAAQGDSVDGAGKGGEGFLGFLRKTATSGLN
jgi:hypothetical protein